MLYLGVWIIMSNIKTSTPANQNAVIDFERMREIARVRWFSLVAEQMEKDAARTEGIEVGIKQGKEEVYEKFRQYFKSQGKTDEEIDTIFGGLNNHE